MSVISASKAQGLGTKRTCRSCSARFYDFNKPEPTCPKCSAIFDINAEPEIPQLPPLTEEELAEMKAEDAELARKAKRKKEQANREPEDDRNSDDGRDEDY